MGEFNLFFTLLSGLGLLVFGVSLLSSSLENLSEDFLTMSFGSKNKKKVSSYGRGILCALALWSSATIGHTVIGLVNGGLMGITSALSLSMGASVGASFISIFIALLKKNVVVYCLGLAIFPYFLSKNQNLKNLGMALFGLGLLILGLDYFASSFGEVFLNLNLSDVFLREESILLISIGLLVGIIITGIFKSTLVGVCILFSICESGMVGYSFGFGFILGANLGKIISIYLISNRGNLHAKRVGLASIFNHLFILVPGILGAYGLIHHVDFLSDRSLSLGSFIVNFDQSSKMALFHFGANIFSNTISLALIPVFKKAARSLRPGRTNGDTYELVALGGGQFMVPTMALVQVQNHVGKFFSIVTKMFELTEEYVKSEMVNARSLATIKDHERITDNIRKETSLFLEKLSEHELSKRQSEKVHLWLTISSHLERVADYIDKLATSRTKIGETKLRKKDQDNLIQYLDKIHHFYINISQLILAGERERAAWSEIKGLFYELKLESERIRLEYVDSQQHLMNKQALDPSISLAYIDMIESLKKIRSHSFVMLATYYEA